MPYERGGSFVLRPTSPFDAARRYVAKTNVLETTFTTATGAVRVTDALTLPGRGLSPYRELARRVEALSGRVSMEWLVEPRFDYALGPTRREQRAGVPVATHGRDAVAVCSWAAGTAGWDGEAIAGSFTATEGETSLVVLSAAHQEPLVLPSRADVEERLRATARTWREWAEGREYDGAWRDAVLRSALALKLLVFAPSGAIAAAATTSLPEEIRGERNWDYRFAWPRDAAFTLEALLALGCSTEASKRRRDRFRWTATAAPGRFESATARPRRRSSTSTAKCFRRSVASPNSMAASTAITAGAPPPSPTSSARPGCIRTPASGKCAASQSTTRNRR